MDDKRWERVAALGGGVLFVVLILVSTFLPGTPPDIDAPAKEVGKFFAEKTDELKLAAYLGGLASIPILFWLGSLWRTLRRAEGENPRLTVVAAAALVLVGAAAGVSNVVLGVTAVRIESLGDSGAQFFYTLAMAMYGMAAFGFTALVVAVGAVAYRTGVFPKWLCYVGAALGALWAVAAVSSVSLEPVFATLGMIAFIVTLVWILYLSVLMYRGAEAEIAA